MGSEDTGQTSLIEMASRSSLDIFATNASGVLLNSLRQPSQHIYTYCPLYSVRNFSLTGPPLTGHSLFVTFFFSGASVEAPAAAAPASITASRIAKPIFLIV